MSILSRRTTIIGLAACLYSAISNGTAASAAGPELTGHMQNFQLAPSTQSRPADTWNDESGKPVSLADFAGKVVMVNFWASWCPPCLRELPSINRLQATLGGKDFTIVALNIDQAGKPIAKRLSRKLKLDKLALYLDPKSAVTKSWKIKTMPTTILFDQKGREVGRLEGGVEWDTPATVSLVKFFIENPGYADTLPVKKGS
jgi:thiol-disulfide isomerase/thioredoxin